MTKVTVIKDDLDGSDDAATVYFSFGGTDYEIDLSTKNALALEKALEKYIAKATISQGVARTRAPRGSGSRPVPSKSKDELDAIRTWARANGHEVAPKGRIAQTIQDAFYAAKVEKVSARATKATDS